MTAATLAEAIKSEALADKSIKKQAPASALTWRWEDGMLIEERVCLRGHLPS